MSLEVYCSLFATRVKYTNTELAKNGASYLTTKVDVKLIFGGNKPARSVVLLLKLCYI